MTVPSQMSRDLREAMVKRRLAIAEALRKDPSLTNVQLAARFGVSRNTVATDREAIVKQLAESTVSETEALRWEMQENLKQLIGELERHRKNGKLPVGVIHEMLMVNRSIIELLGVRNPVEEHIKVTRQGPPTFEVTIVKSPPLPPPFAHSEVVGQLPEGDQETENIWHEK